MGNERTFNLRFSLSAVMGEDLLANDEFDENAWLNEWEVAIKPGLVRAVFSHLRSFSDWEAHVRNRGMSPLDEIEIVCTRSFDR